MKHAIWTPAELKLLARVWPPMGLACADQFPRHSANAVKVRAYAQGLRYSGKRTYSMWSEIKPSRSCGSGVVAGPPYSGVLARERLAELGK